MIDVENAKIDEQVIRDIGELYLTKFNHWYSYLLHRNQLVATILRDEPLPKTDLTRLYFLAETLKNLPNHRGKLAKLIKNAIAEALNDNHPDGYLHILLHKGIDASSIIAIGKRYVDRHGSVVPNFIARLNHGHQAIAVDMQQFKGSPVLGYHWVYLAKVWLSLRTGELSSAIDALFLQHFKLHVTDVITKLDLLTFTQRYSVFQLQHMVTSGQVTPSNEAQIQQKLESALKQGLPKETQLSYAGMAMVSLASMPNFVKYGAGMGAVGVGTGIVVGAMVLGGAAFPVVLVAGAGAVVVSSLLIGSNLATANHAGHQLNIKKEEIIKFRTANEVHINQYVTIFMRLSREIKKLAEVSSELSNTSTELRNHVDRLEHATRRIEELETVERNLKKDIKALEATIGLLASTTKQQSGITMQLGEHTEKFKQALEGVILAKAEFERMKDEYQRLIDEHQQLLSQQRDVLVRHGAMVERQERISSNPHGLYYPQNSSSRSSEEVFEETPNLTG